MVAAKWSDRRYWRVRGALTCFEELHQWAAPWRAAGLTDLTGPVIEDRVNTCDALRTLSPNSWRQHNTFENESAIVLYVRTLFMTSVVTSMCAILIWVYVAPQMVTTGVVETGQLFEIMVLLPTLVGLPTSSIGMVTGLSTLCRGSRSAAFVLMTSGQVLTIAIAVAIVVWAVGFGSTGWELIALPMSLACGQILVFAGIVAAGVQRRRPTSA